MLPDAPEQPVLLPASTDLVARYVALTQQRRALDEQLAFLRGELELAAASGLCDERPVGRFEAPGRGVVVARLQPSCVFDRQVVGRELQRMGRLAEVGVVHGPVLARFLAREPVVAARLGSLVRARRSIWLTAGAP